SGERVRVALHHGLAVARLRDEPDVELGEADRLVQRVAAVVPGLLRALQALRRERGARLVRVLRASARVDLARLERRGALHLEEVVVRGEDGLADVRGRAEE